MKSLIRTISIVLGLSLASPLFGATVAYDFEASGGASNPNGRLIGQLSIDLNGTPLFSSNRFMSRHSDIGYINAVVVGGLQDGTVINAEQVTIRTMFSRLTNVFLVRSDKASLVMARWNAPFVKSSDLSALSFSAGSIWVRDQGAFGGKNQRYDLTTLSASNLVSVPLPATFPMFLGVCLGAAFISRKRERS